VHNNLVHRCSYRPVKVCARCFAHLSRKPARGIQESPFGGRVVIRNFELRAQTVRGEGSFQVTDYQAFNVRGRESTWNSRSILGVFDNPLGGVVTIPFSVLNRMRRRVPSALLVKQKTFKDTYVGGIRAIPPRDGILLQPALYGIP
jgi:hypothetical protein